MVLNLNHKEKMQEDDIELTNCVHMTATRLIKCVPIVVTTHVETVVKLVRKTPDAHVDLGINMDELDLTTSEAKATYQKIKDYIKKEYDMTVSSLYIAQVKQKYGIIERDCYNKPKNE